MVMFSIGKCGLYISEGKTLKLVCPYLLIQQLSFLQLFI